MPESTLTLPSRRSGQGGKNEGQGGKGEGHGCSGSKTSPVGIPPCRVRLNLVIAFVL